MMSMFVATLLLGGSLLLVVASTVKPDDYWAPNMMMHSRPRRIRQGGNTSPSSSSMLLLLHGGDELNAKDFGAIGDGVADDSRPLQKAIDAAQKQGRRLVLPGGQYLINTTLSVAPTAGPGAAAALNLIGQGHSQSVILAGRAMNAVLNFSACCGAVPKHSSNEPNLQG